MKGIVLSVEQKGSKMPTCKKCGYQNKERNKYCVNCGAELKLTKEDLEAKIIKERGERVQKAFYLLASFITFAIIDVAVAYDFPLLLIGGLLTDVIICAFLWFTWLGR